MTPEFLEYLEEKYALKTQSNYIRSINLLEKNKVDLEDRSSFKQWLITQKNKGMKNITINMYLRPALNKISIISLSLGAVYPLQALRRAE